MWLLLKILKWSPWASEDHQPWPSISCDLPLSPLCLHHSSFSLFPFWLQFLWASGRSWAARRVVLDASEWLPFRHSGVPSTWLTIRNGMPTRHASLLQVPPSLPFTSWCISATYWMIFCPTPTQQDVKCCEDRDLARFVQCWIPSTDRSTWHTAGVLYYFLTECHFD